MSEPALLLRGCVVTVLVALWSIVSNKGLVGAGISSPRSLANWLRPGHVSNCVSKITLETRLDAVLYIKGKLYIIKSSQLSGNTSPHYILSNTHCIGFRIKYRACVIQVKEIQEFSHQSCGHLPYNIDICHDL